jgi:hypothetical protein
MVERFIIIMRAKISAKRIKRKGKGTHNHSATNGEI